jgi:hypothetical protein
MERLPFALVSKHAGKYKKWRKEEHPVSLLALAHYSQGTPECQVFQHHQ